MPFVRRDGIDIHYETYPCEDESRGTLLFVPGLSANTRAFPGLFAALAEIWRVIVIDPRGAGRSVSALHRFSLADIAADALAVLDQEGVEEAHVLGLSMGGMIAQEIALDAPDRVRGLVLCCTMCGRHPGVRPGAAVVGRLVRGLASARGPATAENIADGFGGILFADGTDREKKLEFFGPRSGASAPRKRGILSQLLAVRTFSTFDRLHRIGSPTLVIHGDSDILVPTVNAMILADAIHGVELEILPGGHVFFFEHQPEFLERVVGFLDRVEAAE